MRLELVQKQKTELVMTAKLSQAINLLQYNTVELLEFIEEQATENPLIEVVESRMGDDDHLKSMRRKMNTGENYVNPIDYTAGPINDVLEDILDQIRYLEIETVQRHVVEYIVLNLDDHGFLPVTTKELAEQLKTSQEMIETCLQIVHHLEPIGLGAQNLKECLLIQAKHFFPNHKSMHTVIENHLSDFAYKKWQEVSGELHISLEELKEIADLIKTLRPRPCTDLFHHQVKLLIPDIMITLENGEYSVTMGDRYLPKVTLNMDYLKYKNRDSETSAYIQTHYQNYQWMVSILAQRQETILKIVKVIIDKQPDFLKQGFTHLKPMTLKEIAKIVGMHESTVSRATSNKIIQTPVGTFDMKKLFSAKLKSSDTGYASAAQVKLFLKQLILQESPKKPYSDQKLAEYLLVQKGITISRRTIAKYREELGILSSAKRKRYRGTVLA